MPDTTKALAAIERMRELVDTDGPLDWLPAAREDYRLLLDIAEAGVKVDKESEGTSETFGRALDNLRAALARLGE